MLTAYTNAPLPTRLLLVVVGAILVNTAYCLVYTALGGQSETLAEAALWSVVHVAPWVAAIEVARHFRRPAPVALALIAALGLSLVLDLMAGGTVPSTFDLVQRLPWLLAALAVLCALQLLGRRERRKKFAALDRVDAEWIRAAGNYCELHSRGVPVQLSRTTLSSLTGGSDSRLVRIHRSYAVRREAILRLERHNVVLADGTRLPIGDAYRADLASSSISS